MGVICPMVNTKAEAEQFVAACKYPPAGRRSNGPLRAAMYGEASSYQKTANDEILVIPMIETEEALENLEAILDVPGIDMVYVGPSDLALSLGLNAAMDREEPNVLEMYQRVLRETSKRNLIAGLHNATSAYAARMIAMGFRFATISNDSGLMARAAIETVRATRKAAGDIAN